MSEIKILGVLVANRSEAALKVQEILTRYGCSIKTRLGLNELEIEKYKDSGIIILELIGEEDECVRLENELWAVEGTKIQKMVF